MRSEIVPALALAGAVLVAATTAHSQPVPAHTHMPGQTLFTARANADQVVPPAASKATATGAFVLSKDARSVAYRVSWNGVATDVISAIDVHDFGRGGVGRVVATLCAEGATRCPQRSGGTIEGTFGIEAALARELGVERFYIDIHTEGAKDGALRGQILPLPWMVHSEQFVARLRRSPRDMPGNGTATLYVTHFPQGTQIQFDVTVADMPAGAARVEIRHPRTNEIAGGIRVDGNLVRQRGGTISAVIPPAQSRAARSDSVALAVRAGPAILSVVVGNKTIASGILEPVL